MSERNKELSRQNQILNRELTILQKETQEDSLRKENQINEMTKANRQLQRDLEEQEILIASLRAENTRILNDQKLFLKKSDMLRNIKLLNDAYTSKKISQEKHMVIKTDPLALWISSCCQVVTRLLVRQVATALWISS